MKLFIGILLLVVAQARQERCGANQHFDNCGSACPLTCSNFILPEEPCERTCIAGCHCDDGFVLTTAAGNCVKPEDCPTVNAVEKNCVNQPETGPCRAAFHNWYYDQQSGECREFIYGGCDGNGNRYWSEEECQRNCAGKNPCMENAYFDSCGWACQRTCDNPDVRPESCVRLCISGCHCNQGFVRNRNGNCVTLDKC